MAGETIPLVDVRGFLAVVGALLSLVTTRDSSAVEIVKAPKGFSVVVETSRGERIDTKSGLVTKDLVSAPDTTIALQLTRAELDTLYTAVVQFRVLDLPSPHPKQDIGASRVPNYRMTVSIHTPTGTKALDWSTAFGPHADASAEWRRLHGFVRIARQLVQNHAAYRKLPTPRSGYL